MKKPQRLKTLKFRAALAAALLSLLAALPAAAQEAKIPVVTLPVTGDGLGDTLKRSLRGTVNSALGKYYQIYDEDKIDAIYKREFEKACRENPGKDVSRGCSLALVNELGSELVAKARIDKTGSDWIISVQVKNAFTSEIVENFNGDCAGCRPAELRRAVEAAVDRERGQGGSSVAVIHVNTDAPKTPGSSELIIKVKRDNTKSKVAVLTFVTEPPGASVFAGEKNLGTVPNDSPFATPLAAGQRVVLRLELPEYHPLEIDLNLTGGKNDLGNIKLKPAFGFLEVITHPAGATAQAGGKSFQTPGKQKLASGKYRVSVTKKLYDSFFRSVAVRDGQTETVEADLTPNFGEVSLRTSPPGAQVRVKNPAGQTVFRGKAPVDAKLEPGEYELEITAPGHDPAKGSLTVSKGGKLSKTANELSLRRRGGYLTPMSKPFDGSAKVLLNGKEIGQVGTPLFLPEGTHEISAISQKHGAAKKSVTVRDRQDDILELTLSKIAGGATINGNMVRFPAGTFTMGSNNGDSDEKPVREVYLDAYAIDAREVTVEQYKQCADAGKCGEPRSSGTFDNWGKSGREKHPINGVSWNDARDFCAFAGKRLPTEAEWERAATWKNGKKHKFPSGKNSVSCADAVMDDGCGKVRTWPVGSKPAEINGTLDMAGNVWEWVADWYGKYPVGKQANPKGPASGKNRVSRGGGWGNNSGILRGAFRHDLSPSYRFDSLGFRCARSAAGF